MKAGAFGAKQNPGAGLGADFRGRFARGENLFHHVAGAGGRRQDIIQIGHRIRRGVEHAGNNAFFQGAR